jgi:hypothetical protein
MRERNAYILGENLKRKYYLEDLSVDGRILLELKWIF